MAFMSAAFAQVTIPAGTDIGTYLNTGTNWSATNYQFNLGANATWNTVITVNTAAHSTLSLDGAGNTVTRAGSYLIAYNASSIDQNSVTLSNINFGQTANSGTALFYNTGGARTSNLFLNSVTFNGLQGAFGNIFYMSGTTGSTIMNITAGTGANGVTFSNNVSSGDGAGVISMYAGNMNFYGDYTFDSNTTGNYGGAISMYQSPGVMTFYGTTAFINNHSTTYFGGAIDIWGGASTLTFNGVSTFTGNYVNTSATGSGNPRGGAINIGYTSPGSGASVVQFNAPVTFDGNYIVSTGSGGIAYGGGISAFGNGASYNYQYIFNAAAIFENNYVVKAGTGSGGGYGGAIYYDASGALVSLTSGTQFLNNYASTSGGAIYLQSGTITMSALTDNILFQGNRQGATFGSSGNYAPVIGTGTPNAIYLGSSGSLNLNANAGYQIQFYDPISSIAGSTVTVTKAGAGEAIFYGDNGATTTYDSTIQANTTVSGGYFTLANGVNYGNTSGGVFTVTTNSGAGTAGTVRGGGGSSLRGLTFTVQSGGTVEVTDGTFTVNVGTINVQSGGQFAGNGTLAATSNINLAGTTIANVNAGETLNISGLLANTGGITVQGGGTLALSNAGNTYTGATTVSAGSTLLGGVANAFSTSGSVAVNGTLDLSQNNLNQTANNLSGSGSVLLGSATLTAVNGATNTTYAGALSGAGVLNKTGTGALTLSGTTSDYSGGTTIGAGTLIATNGAALGSGAVGNAATLQLDFAADSTLANQLTGAGTLNKTSTGVATLTGLNSTQGTVTVTAGTLAFQQNGVFAITGGLTTSGGATTQLGPNSQLTLGGVLTQAAGSTLNVDVGAGNEPLITAASASLNGTLNIASFAGALPTSASALASTEYTLIHTTGGTGDFASFTFVGYVNPVDYLTLGAHRSTDGLDYNAGFGLTWQAGATLGNGTFTLANATDAFNVDAALADQDPSATGWDGTDLTKEGAGTLTLSAQNTYTGTTVVNGGTLATGVADAIAASSAVTVASGATLALNDFSQTLNDLSGAGAVTLGSSAATVLTANNNAATTFAGAISGAGSVDKTGTGALTLSGTSNTYSGGTTVSAGTLVTTNGNALGTGTVTNNAALQLDFASNSTLANTLSGTGSLTKTGAGTATLSAAGSTEGAVSVNAGTLAFAQSGVFSAASYATQSAATTSIGASSQLATTGAFTQAAGSTLNVAIGSNQPAISAATASLAGTLNVTGFTATAPTSASALPGTLYTIVHTTGGITGDFGTISLGGASSTVDYLTLAARASTGGLDYNVGFGLTWQAGTTLGNGTFTLTNAADAFNVDVALANEAASSTGWDGTDLTKAGAGTLTLSAQNTYTGTTTVNGGTLAMGIANAIASSSAVTVNSGATLALNDFSQTLNDLSGAGAVTLGSSAATVLTASNNAATTFSGAISGGGSVDKTGTGALTLSGASNTYSGGTTVSAGTLIATNGNALGTGAVTNDAALQLDFASNSTLANALSGTGSLTKTGAGTATLTAAGSSEGAVSVNAGTLQFAQNGVFNAASFTTQSGATTSIGASSQLATTGAFTQAADSTLNVAIGSNSPAISAATASLAGTLNVTGFTTPAPTSASALPGTLYTIVHTTGGITGDFGTISMGGAASTLDYLTLAARASADGLDYNVGYGLTWQAGATLGNGTFTLTNAADAFNVDVALANEAASSTGWDGTDLTKDGAGTLTLSAVNTYTGTTTVDGGTLAMGIANAIAASSAVTVNSGATLALNDFSQTLNDLSGAGAVTLGSSAATVLTANNAAATTFSGAISGAGSVDKTGTGALTLSGTSNTYSGGTTVSAGTLVATNGGALGTGTVTNNAALQLDFASNSTLANTLSGTGSLTKTGAGTATLSAAGSTEGAVSVNAGTLAFAQSGVFSAASYATQSAATTSIGASSQLATTGAFTQAAGSTLNVAIGSNQPAISAATASLAGTLNVTGFTATAPTSASALPGTLYTILHTTGGITGDFGTISLGGASSQVDYLTLAARASTGGLDYNVGFGLTWQAGATLGNGTFTLTNAADAFNVDAALANEAASSTGWDGTDLTKAGAGTLTLSAQNTYTGTTTVNGGTLAMGIANAIASSSAVTVNSGATLALNDFSQTLNDLSGAGAVTLGSSSATVLTANNTVATTFSGAISGGGSVNKTGTGALTLSGTSNTYSGGTTVSAGTLIATNGNALGTGAVTNDAALQLDFASNSTLANALSGTGSLIKTGAGTATLTAAGSTEGAVSVNAGTLAFAQSGVFNAANFTTQNGATTSVGASSQLTASGAFTQAAGSTLNVTLGSNAPAISAASASLNGVLNIAGFVSDQPASASALPGTQYTIIHTTGGVTGDFSSISLGGATSTVDYLTLAAHASADALDYNVGFGLTWVAGATLGNGTFTLTNATDAFDVDVELADAAASATGWNGRDLTKEGAGTLTLSAVNSYTGATTVNGGTLAMGIADAIASSSAVTVNSGATLALNDFSQTVNDLSGAGTVTLGANASTVLTANDAADTTFSGVIGGAGSIDKTGAGALTLSGTSNTYSGGTTVSAGTLVATNGGALGTGTVTNNAALQLDFAGDSTLANTLTGTGSLTKTGAGTATLSAAGSTEGAVSVDAGTLQFAQSGVFNAASYTTQSGATTGIGASSQLVTSGAFTEAAGSTLNVAIGSNQPAISAATASLAGTLNVTGFTATAPTSASALPGTLYTIVHTTGGITGDFSSISLGGAASTVDYLTLAARASADALDYNVGFGLTWQAGTTLSNGTFTLTNAADAFNVDVALANQAASSTGWDGTDLTKEGAGTLTLSAQNTYTGTTTVNGGTLAMGIANAIATSSAVTVNSGATLALNDFSQTLNDLSGAGAVTLGTNASTVLTANNTAATTFSGAISGAGSVDKTGTGALTLSGTSNTYSGGTTVSAGTLVATNGNALGTGAVINNAALQLDFAGNSTLANTLSGTGSLTKTGAGVATLTAAGSTEGAVSVNAGTLAFAQSGVFNAASFTTQSGATTSVGASSQLATTGAFTQAAGSTLSVTVGSNSPAISAATATLNGVLNIAGFTTGAPGSASALPGTLYTILHTTGGITGDFSSITLGGASSPVDYLTLAAQRSADTLDYNVGFGLTWQAGATLGSGTFTLTNATDAFNVDVALANQAASSSGWNGTDLTKAGAGTLTLSAVNSYTGTTTVNGGTLAMGIANAIASSSAVTVNSGATLALNDFSQTVNDLSGAGAVTLGSSSATVLTANNTAATTFSGAISGAGSVNKTGAGALTLSGTSNTYSGGTTVTAGTLVATNGNTLGAGAVTNNAALQLDFAGDSTLANTLSGTGSLTKTGAGTATITATGSTEGAVVVNAGTLAFAQNGAFNAASYSTQSGATTSIGANAQLAISGALNELAGSTLSVSVGTNSPAISAATATLNGALNIAGFTGSVPGSASGLPNTQYTILHTTGGITGDFTSITLGGASSPVDYLTVAAQRSADSFDYNVGLGLTWQAGTTLGNGTFTLTNATDAFNVDVALADQAASSTGWSGADLIKAGAGTLTLSAQNTYTGGTAVNGGTLAMGIANAMASSLAVTVESGATLALNDFSQTLNNLSGSGVVSLGSSAATVLTANNTGATSFSGSISGAGSVDKTGAGELILTGTNTYSGGTTVTAGTLLATNGNAVGTGTVTNNAALQLDFATDSTLANTLSGTGSLTKTGAGVATLSAAGSTQGSVSAAGGTLEFAQDGVFNASDYTTQSGATTSFAGDSQLAVSGAFTEAAGSTLNVTLGSNNPVITANSATLAGVLNIAGFAADAPSSASALTSTRFTIVNTTNGITGDFSGITLGSAASPVDYLVLATGVTGRTLDNLNYTVGFGLAWQAGSAQGNGTFTLAHASDAFNVDVALADQAASATGWNGIDLTKAGAGTLTLSALNRYTGTTTVNGGTLAMGIANAIATSSAVTVNSGATLALNDFSQTVNNLSGAGAVALGSSSATVLTASNSADTTFSGTMSGAGSLSKTGAGALTLAGANTYSGGTLISEGTLIGSAASFGSGSIMNYGALVIDQPANVALANVLNGTGTFTKTGAGSLNLTGENMLTGATTVAAGRLAVNGSMVRSNVTVQNGATLGGNGTVGPTTIQSGGTIAPGNSIGTLTVNAGFVQAAGSIYQVELDPTSTSSDRIHVNGSAAIGQGAVLDVVKYNPGEYSAASTYTVLTATGGVSGAYTLTGATSGAFYDLVASYDANNVYLKAYRTRYFVDAAGTPNQRATAGGLDRLDDSNALKVAVAALTNDAEARAAFDQLSGEIHASVKSALLDDSRYVREVAIDRVRQSFCLPGGSGSSANPIATAQLSAAPSTAGGECALREGEPVVWTHVFGGWGHMNGDGNAATLRQNTGGFLMGADALVAQRWRVGALAGYSGTNMNVDDRSSSASSNNYHVGVYGGSQWGALGVRAGAAYTWHSIDTTRSPVLTGYSDRLTAGYNAQTVQVFGDVGYRIPLRQMSLEPFASLAYVNLHTDAINEQGGLAALHASSSNTDATFSTLGIRQSIDVALRNGTLMTASATLGWQHAFGDVVPVSALAFAGGSAFDIAGVPIARNAALVEAGLDFHVTRNASLGLTYRGQFGSGTTSQYVQGSLKMRF
ncbi:autotransporter-associated beta strand repeat-containing protein [Burkholderia sp. SRS-W-2-2016]|uniref:autotransporter-associated beta strand repeat-containing protein n=1 Tax=Burkholderia sp. SRS-W-2-2016 TaxID=1926878 RepID=UPI002116FF4C|nr:autotransporter-associated beta strand repeat-containing protein [Burkholderia sp. SRS-W-2-2016]